MSLEHLSLPIFPRPLSSELVPELLGTVGVELFSLRYEEIRDETLARLGTGPDLSDLPTSFPRTDVVEVQQVWPPTFKDTVLLDDLVYEYFETGVPNGYGLSGNGTLLSPADLSAISSAARVAALNNAEYVRLCVGL